MYYFPDFLVFFGLLLDGFFFGYYCKFAYVYNNLWTHWYSMVGMIASLLLAGMWTLKKYKQRQYCYDHFHVIFYGLICFLISACFMLNENLVISFYFGFMAHATLFLPCYSYISIRSSSNGLRPARVALGNTLYFTGLTIGFIIFNEFEAKSSAFVYLGITVALILAAIANEVLQHVGVHDYKKSYDIVFNLMNDEKIVFLPTKSIYALFVGRPDFYITKSNQALIVGMVSLLVLERSFLYSNSFLELSWSSTFGYTGEQYLYGPFLFYTFGAALGSALMMRYRPKLIYLMFGLIKVTASVAILSVYSEFATENSFLFLGLYYMSMGLYSSIALQGVLECSPFIFTELILAGAYVLDLLMLEVLKHETDIDNTWSILLGIGVSTMILTAACIVLVQVFLPQSEGLIEVRNRLLGIRRHKPVVPQSKIWNANYFLHHDLQPNELTNITLDGNRVFQQYPREAEKKSRF